MTQAVSTAISPSLIDNNSRIQQHLLIPLISLLKCLKVSLDKIQINLQLFFSIIHQPWSRITYRSLPLLIVLPQRIILSSLRGILSTVVGQRTEFRRQKGRLCLSLFESARRPSSKSVCLRTASGVWKTRSTSRLLSRDFKRDRSKISWRFVCKHRKSGKHRGKERKTWCVKLTWKERRCPERRALSTRVGSRASGKEKLRLL